MTTKKTDIRAKTISMLPPILSADNKTKRRPEINNEIFGNLITQEAFLRRLAYKNTTIRTSELFFDDSDMLSEYYLIVIYDKAQNIPLLSTRYYFDKAVIAKYLKGDNNMKIKQNVFGETLNINNYEEGKIFLADRLSGNISSSIYRQNRSQIFSLLYAEILTYNRDCSLILMARSEKYEKLLTKYLNLGFNIISSTMHNGKEHWIILADLKQA